MHDARLWPASILSAAEGDLPAAMLHAAMPAEYTGASDSLAAKLRRSFGQAASPAVEVTTTPKPSHIYSRSVQASFSSDYMHVMPLLVLL